MAPAVHQIARGHGSVVHQQCFRLHQSRLRGGWRTCSSALSPQSRGATASTAVAGHHRRKIDVDITKTSLTSRKIQATVHINAPVEVVWSALTDYDNLHQFIPGLVQNKCLQRRPSGCILYQESAQDVAMGVKFSAACKLDIAEYPSGLPGYLCAEEGVHDYDRFFPCAAAGNTGLPLSDISFSLLEGDFAAFKGVWRLQCASDRCNTTLLNYSLYVKPMPWLPVGLIQNRIEKEVVTNLKAVQAHTEKLHRSGAASSGSSSSGSSSSSLVTAESGSSVSSTGMVTASSGGSGLSSGDSVGEEVSSD